MKTKIAHIATAFALLFASSQLPASASDDLIVAQDECTAVGRSLAKQKSARLVAATAVTQNGRAACEVVLLVSPTNGGRPTREVVVVNR